MFFIIECSYAGDNAPYISADNIDGVIKILEKASEILFKWFKNNLMKTNTEKCHLLVSTNNTVKMKIGNLYITSSKSEKLLGVKFDHKLSFDNHISELCKKALRKTHTLSRVTLYVNVSKRRVLLNVVLLLSSCVDMSTNK